MSLLFHWRWEITFSSAKCYRFLLKSSFNDSNKSSWYSPLTIYSFRRQPMFLIVHESQKTNTLNFSADRPIRSSSGRFALRNPKFWLLFGILAVLVIHVSSSVLTRRKLIQFTVGQRQSILRSCHIDAFCGLLSANATPILRLIFKQNLSINQNRNHLAMKYVYDVHDIEHFQSPIYQHHIIDFFQLICI